MNELMMGVIVMAIVVGGLVYYKITMCRSCTSGCAAKKTKDEPVRQIAADALKREIETNNNLVIVNVLPEDYFADCRIKGSKNIPYKKIQQEAYSLDKNKDIVVYCASYACHASLEAYKQLLELGFKSVRAYEGGMKEWLMKGYPAEGPCTQDYLKEK